MSKENTILILGYGRIANAVLYFLRKKLKNYKVSFLKEEKELEKCSLLVGALAGELGEKGLRLALKYKVNLIDISDIDPPFYLSKKNEIKKCGIIVIPGCGFSPGLTNFILGYEASKNNNLESIEIEAGSLSKKRFYFPFLWCFEDLILEHKLDSFQIVDGKKKKFLPFSNYREEEFNNIAAESYFCPSGFENIFKKVNVKNFSCRVVRPLGFEAFFKFSDNLGLFKKETLMYSKKTFESVKEDNMTLGKISFLLKRKGFSWVLQSYSKKEEKLNSMQKITATMPAVIASLIIGRKIKEKGLIFMEDLATTPGMFNLVVSCVKDLGIIIKRQNI